MKNVLLNGLISKTTLDFPAWVGYNKLQVEQYDGAVTTELNIVNPTSMCKCRHTQALGAFYTILEVVLWSIFCLYRMEKIALLV